MDIIANELEKTLFTVIYLFIYLFMYRCYKWLFFHDKFMESKLCNVKVLYLLEVEWIF